MLARLRIGTALYLGFAAVIAAAVSLGAVSWVGLRSVGRGVQDLSERALPNTRALARLDQARADAMRSVNALWIPRLQAERWKFAWARLDETLVEFSAERKKFEEAPSEPETGAAWKELEPDADRWLADIHVLYDVLKRRNQILERGVAYDSREIQAVEEEGWAKYVSVRESAKALDHAFVKVRAAMAKESKGQAARAFDAAHSATWLLGISAVIAIAIAAAFAAGLTRAIGRAIQGLDHEAKKLSSAVAAGELHVRADERAVHFQFRSVVHGMNATMDAYAGPIEASTDCAEHLARGETPPRIAEDYRGEFNRIKTSLNALIDVVAHRGRDVNALIRAAVEGRLDARADASKYTGEHAHVIDGMNQMLDAMAVPLKEATCVLERLADRDLRARVEGQYQGDHAKIADAVNTTANALHDALAQVAQSVEQVSSASAQIASSSQAVASGASEQASSLEETNSSLESMASMTRGMADNAQQASTLAAAAKAAAAEGRTTMEQMTTAMARIKASAEGTAQIIKDINEIAFQTNLLALNAAVEAARAGEAGRGFAVVAEEVRSLALRSKEAANKTEELIRQSVKEALDGEITAKAVDTQLSQIAEGSAKAHDVVTEITAASKEQAAGIEQITRAMSQMNTVTQQNAASSEESSSAATELSSQSEELAAMIGAFKLNAGTVARRPSSSAELAPGASGRRPMPAPSSAPPKQANGLHPGHHQLARPEQVIPLGETPTFDEF